MRRVEVLKEQNKIIERIEKLKEERGINRDKEVIIIDENNMSNMYRELKSILHVRHIF